MTIDKLQKLAKLIRYYILTSTTQAGSGHPTSSLSATDLMTVLLFGGFFRSDLKNPQSFTNDRLIFSKGHASPLFYALFLAAEEVTPEEMMTLRKFESRLEGHPTPRFPFTEAATGSLGQGLSVGAGEALALRAKIQNPPKVFVLLGDGEMAEGSTWEAINLAGYYGLDNLVAIVDVNRLGQSQATMAGWEIKKYQKRFEAFGWETAVIDGHNYGEIADAFRKTQSEKKPFAIIAKTIKGKGVSFLEDKEGWHGKPLSADQLEKALAELGEVDLKVRGKMQKPVLRIKYNVLSMKKKKIRDTSYKPGDQIATRKAYGTALARLGEYYPGIVSLDAEVKNSTYAEIFKEKFPDRFFEMFIAEQNMVGAAVGFSKLGYLPFVSTFSAFLTRAFDQVRMAALSQANVKFCGSHAGVSIGEDGPSQMGLEDLAMFRAVHGSVVLYPADAVAAEKLVEEMVRHKGICYLRTTRSATPVIYDNNEEFPIGGVKIHRLPVMLNSFQHPQEIPKQVRDDNKSKIIIIAAGITLFEVLKAQEELNKEGVEVTVVDCYSIKPIDEKTLVQLTTSRLSGIPPVAGHNSQLTTYIITVEDHWSEGGLGDAVLNVFAESKKVSIHKLAVTKMPRSGKPAELLDFEGISAKAIAAKVKSFLA